MTTRALDIAGREGGLVSLSPERLDELTTRIEGRVLRPSDHDWDDAVLIWNAMAAHTPALVVQPVSAIDVATAVEFARAHGLLLSVKGGGRNIAGTSIAQDGLTLDMSRMRDVTVDTDAQLAHVGLGCLLQDVDRATQQHGLATVLGFISAQPTAQSAPPTARAGLSCSGRYAAAAATSAQSPASPSDSTRSAR